MELAAAGDNMKKLREISRARNALARPNGIALSQASITSMKTFVLLVTWMVSGRPPSSYRTIFNSGEACEAARNSPSLARSGRKAIGSCSELVRRIIRLASPRLICDPAVMRS
jgi:hypothetical protein